MDPVSLIASALTFGQLTIDILGTGKAFYRARHEYEELSEEAHRLHQLLIHIHDAFFRHDHLDQMGILLEPLSCAATKFKALNGILSGHPTDHRLHGATRSRIVYTVHKDQLVLLRNSLRELRNDILTTLVLISMSSTIRITNALASVNNQSHMTGASASDCLNQQDLQHLLRVDTGAIQILHQSPNASSSLVPNPSSGVGPNSDLHDDAKWQKQTNASNGRLSLVPYCKCLCHDREDKPDSWSWGSFLGTLHVHALVIKPVCCESRKKRAQKYILSLVYRFPSFLLNKSIALLIGYDLCQGLRMSLRALIVTDHSHLLWTYVKSGNVLAVQSLFSQRKASPFDMDITGSDALLNLAWRDNVEMIQLLLQEGANPHLPDRAGRTASQMLWTSALTGRFGLNGTSDVSSWLKEDDYADIIGLTPAHQIVIGCDRDLCAVGTWFSKAINDVDPRGRSPLMWAVLTDNPRAVQQLLAMQASIDVRDRRGKSCLHYVKHPAVLKSLINAGAHTSLPSTNCLNTPLHEIAIRHDSVEIIDALHEAQVPLDILNHYGVSPLFNAVSYGRTRVASRLLELRSDPNVTARTTGCSVLHEAIQMNHHKILRSLLDRGADVNAICSEGQGMAHKAATFASLKTLRTLGDLRPAMFSGFMRCKDKLGRTPSDCFRERVALIGNETDLETAWDYLFGEARYEMA